MEKNTELLPEFVLGSLRSYIRNNELSNRFLATSSEEEIVSSCDKIINKMCPDDLFKAWLEWEGIVNYDRQIMEAVAAIYQVQLIREHERTWCCWKLSEEDIVGVAKQCGESLVGVDFDEVARRVKKGIEVAVEDVWEDCIKEAIIESRSLER